MTGIDKNLLLSNILEKYPETLDVFLANGFEDKDALIAISPFIRLKTILKTGKLNEEAFIKMLEEKINNSSDNLYKDTPEIEDKLNLLALLPCPLKLPVQEAFRSYINSGNIKPEDNLDYLIEGNANNQLSYYSYVEQLDDIDEIPDIVISPGINSFFYKSFVNKFIDKGFFADAAQYIPNDALSRVGIKDPGNNYTIITMNLLVIVVDKIKIGNRPLPSKWGDLLNPEFEKSVAIRGKNNFFCETTLLTIYKQFGIEGIRKLGKAVNYGWHPAQMAKSAGSGNVDSPVVSVMPYFFTKTIKHKENVKVVWPEDGAIVSPVTMLVKAEKAQELKKISEFFTGKGVGQICAEANFPSLNPEVDNEIPENAAFNWVGWDFIKQNDVGTLINTLNSEFLKAYDSKYEISI